MSAYRNYNAPIERENWRAHLQEEEHSWDGEIARLAALDACLDGLSREIQRRGYPVHAAEINWQSRRYLLDLLEETRDYRQAVTLFLEDKGPLALTREPEYTPPPQRDAGAISQAPDGTYLHAPMDFPTRKVIGLYRTAEALPAYRYWHRLLLSSWQPYPTEAPASLRLQLSPSDDTISASVQGGQP